MKRYWLIILIAVALPACETAYYNTMEKLGVHKREILVDRVEEARDSQQEAQEQFKSALDQFKSVVPVEGGELEKVYERLNGEYEDSEAAASEIRERIDNIETVAEALFDEWENELDQYSSGDLRRDSAAQLRETRDKYKQLIKVMRNAEDRLNPVLEAMEDQVLYLKHNLNARAIQSLRAETVKIDRDVDALLAAMEKAITEADAFIRDMRS